jgi:hypothetical protein
MCFDFGSAGGVVPREDATTTAAKTVAWSKCHRDPMVRQHRRRRRTVHAQQPASPLVGTDFARRATGCRTWPTCYPAERHSLAGMATSHSADLFGNHIRPHLVDRGWVRLLCNARVISSHHHVDLDLWSGLRSEDGSLSCRSSRNFYLQPPSHLLLKGSIRWYRRAKLPLASACSSAR